MIPDGRSGDAVMISVSDSELDSLIAGDKEIRDKLIVRSIPFADRLALSKAQTLPNLYRDLICASRFGMVKGYHHIAEHGLEYGDVGRYINWRCRNAITDFIRGIPMISGIHPTKLAEFVEREEAIISHPHNLNHIYREIEDENAGTLAYRKDHTPVPLYCMPMMVALTAEERSIDISDNPINEVDFNDLCDSVAMAKLDRQVLSLRLDGYTIPEIAVMIGKSVGNVHARIEDMKTRCKQIGIYSERKQAGTKECRNCGPKSLSDFRANRNVCKECERKAEEVRRVARRSSSIG